MRLAQTTADALIHEYRFALLHYAKHYSSNHDTFEDMMQVGRIALWQKAQKLTDERYTQKQRNRLALMIIRRNMLNHLPILRGAGPPCTLGIPMDIPDGGHEDDTLTRVLLHRFMAKLPPRDARFIRALILCRPYSEMAREFGLSKGYLFELRNRLKDQFLKHMRGECYDDKKRFAL